MLWRVGRFCHVHGAEGARGDRDYLIRLTMEIFVWVIYRLIFVSVLLQKQESTKTLGALLSRI